MGSLFGGAPPSGPSETEIRLEAEAKASKLKEEKKKKEESAQRAKNKRGRRSLLSDEDTGSGFPGPSVGGGS